MGNSDLDNKLINRIANDDSNAFEEIFNLYHKRLYAFIYNLISSIHDTEEIVQNVFIAIWNQRKSMKINTSFSSYLFGIARYHIYQHIRQKLNFEAFSEFCLYNNKEYSFITEEEIVFNDLKGRYLQLIKEIPERRREIFLLSRDKGLSYKEISQKLGISENTVDTQIRHALAFLREHLNKG